MEPLSQESPYLNQSNPSYLVTPQNLAACPSDDAQIDLYQQDREMSHYPVNGSHEAPYMYPLPGQDVIQNVNLDPAITNQHLVMDQQQSRPQQTKRLLATPSSRRPKYASTSSSKVSPEMNYPQYVPKGSGSLSVHERTMSDHSSSKPLDHIPDEDQVASNIMEQIRRNSNNPQKLEMVIRSIIKTSGPSLPDPKKLRKRSPCNATGRNTLLSEQARFKCANCNKVKKTQCDLKYRSPSHLSGPNLQFHIEQTLS